MSGLISVAEAHRLLGQHALDLPVLNTPLGEALGARLAEDIQARVSRPPAAMSAMDGYAVQLTDVSTPGARLAVIGDAPAGTPFIGTVGPGEAVRIFTGSVIPDGADHIVIQEDAVRDGDTVTCTLGYDAPRHIREAGIDFSEGDVVLTAGMQVGASELAVAAAANHATLAIRKRPRVGLLANGDELRPPGSTLAPGQIVNSNPPGLSALIAAWGGEPINLGVATDSVASIREHIELAEDIDLFVPIGGASVGDHDHMRSAFAAAEFTPVFEKIAVKPGKPTWFSTRGAQRVLGLPGNPASAFVCAHLFLRPLIAGAAGLSTRKAALSVPLSANGRRETFMRATVNIDAQARLTATPASDQDSSLIKPFLAGNGLIRRAVDAPAAAAGELVDIVLIGPLD